MKRFIANKDGIALVTALILTLISLTIVMSVMYMISQNISTTGANKRYRTALEASYGGTDILMKELVPKILNNNLILSDYGVINLTVDPCLQEKLNNATASWSSACSQMPEAKKSPDIKFDLTSTGGQPYNVYAKIIDTVVRGNSNMSGLQLEGGGVGEQNPIVKPKHLPYIYRLEIQAEKQSNEFVAQSNRTGIEKANISVLYAW